MSLATLAADSFTLFSYMDEVESRVEGLRRQAAALSGEQASLLLIIEQLKRDSSHCEISTEDQLELTANLERLKARCEAVQMQVHTVRDEGQLQSLHKVNSILQDLRSRLFAENDTVPVTAVQQARTYLNACLPEAVGAVDSRFQSLVLGCAVDDQKEVRRRLENLVRDYNSGIRSSSPDPNRGSNPSLASASDQYDSNNSSESVDFVYVSGRDLPQAQASAPSNEQEDDVTEDTKYIDNDYGGGGGENEEEMDNFRLGRFYAPPKDVCPGYEIQGQGDPQHKQDNFHDSSSALSDTNRPNHS